MGHRLFNATGQGKRKTDIETHRDKRWEFPIEFKLKSSCLSPLILLSPSVLSLFVFASFHTPDLWHLPHRLTHFIHILFLQFLTLSLPPPRISLSSPSSVSDSLPLSPNLIPLSHHHKPLLSLLSQISSAAYYNLPVPLGQVHLVTELQAAEVPVMGFSVLQFWMHVFYLLVRLCVGVCVRHYLCSSWLTRQSFFYMIIQFSSTGASPSQSYYIL